MNAKRAGQAEENGRAERAGSMGREFAVPNKAEDLLTGDGCIPVEEIKADEELPRFHQKSPTMSTETAHVWHFVAKQVCYSMLVGSEMVKADQFRVPSLVSTSHYQEAFWVVLLA